MGPLGGMGGTRVPGVLLALHNHLYIIMGVLLALHCGVINPIFDDHVVR